MTDTELNERRSSFVDKDFRGVFRATMNTSGSRLLFLVGGVLLLVVGLAALGCAIYLVVTPLYTVVVNITDANLTDLSGVNWASVHWSIFALCLIPGVVASCFGFVFLRRWKRLRKLPEGILGKGVRVRSNGTVELGSIRVRPASYREILATGKGRVHSIKWKRLARYSAERELLVNLMRNANKELTISHLVLKGSDGHEVMFLGVTQSEDGERDSLWAVDQSRLAKLDRATTEEQLEAVGKLFAPMTRRESGMLALTLTEVAQEANEAEASAEAETLPLTANTLQEQANEQMAAGILPAALQPLAGIVDQYGYTLKPNVDAERFRGE
ncbi:MAG: hypothetical protein ABR907_13150 [Terracidiphilus sp.]